MLALGEGGHQRGQRGGELDGGDVGSGRHDVADGDRLKGFGLTAQGRARRGRDRVCDLLAGGSL